ncbi:hypothetical protein CK489_32740 [Bradyrhizobium sp. UFLA03-84]|uniref:hypothetical protein n=1 Tax=Bradyrhizobium sp. UFLA03-84 TaxID=418599 RepID=UPI000BAE05B0|nr:hypothetical protein [Bradyrhizobium sp. UFLA03-84]PAY04056.1 hypothetical protein CK489_32740 [Bradyrhizobium sp. UFLA03-84]
MDALDGILLLLGSILGWPIRRFGRWLDRQPHRAPSQISPLQKIGRLALAAITAAILVPLGRLIF